MPKLAERPKPTRPVQAAGSSGPDDGDPSADQFPDLSEPVVPDPNPTPKTTAKKTTAAGKKAPPTAIRPDSPLRRAQPLTASGIYVNGLWYGREGTGKTTDVLHMANLGKVLAINAEGGFEKRPLLKHGVNVDNIIVFPPEDDPAALNFENLESIFVDMRRDLEEDRNSWAGTVWDSGGEIASVLLGETVHEAQQKAEAKSKDRDPWLVDIADYGVMARKFRQLLTRYRDLPCHFAITALERRDIDDDGKVAYGPAVIPSLMTDLLGLPKIVIHTSVDEIAGEEEFIGDTRPRGKYRAKDRFDALPHRMIDPNFLRVLGYVTDELDSDSDPVQIAIRERLEAARVDRTPSAGQGEDKGQGKARPRKGAAKRDD